MRRGIAANPRSPLLHESYSVSLFNAGYVRQSVEPAMRAVELNPLRRDPEATAVRRLLAAERADEGLARQDEIERHWGELPDIWRQRALLLRYDPDPRRALARLASHPSPAADENRMIALELRWRADPRAFDWDAFDRAAADLAAESPSSIWGLVAQTGRMGDEQRAFAWLARAPTVDANQQWSLLFWPEAAPIRRDPRFFAKMAALGLVAQWRASGHWPDFCSESGLDYDCRKMARRLARPDRLRPT